MDEVNKFFGLMMRYVPHWILGLLLLAAAAAVAASLCRWIIGFVYRWALRRGGMLPMLVNRCRGPSCALIVLFALGAVLPFAPFTVEQSFGIGHLLLAGTVLVIGWSVLNTIDMLADLYLARFKMDVADNLTARKHATQVGILRGATRTLIVLLTVAVALMTSSSVRQYGVSLFASAGAAGLVVGLAARPLLSNLLAGIQIAITQPIRLEDAVIVEGEWGWIESIGSTYVVVRIWDLRRLIVPLSYFIEQPFQNWTHRSADLLGAVMVHVDYSVPVDEVRAKLQEIVKDHPKWDGKVAGVQMTDLPGAMVELRLLVSSNNAGNLFDLRCIVREAIVQWLQQEHPQALPRQRAQVYADLPAVAAPSPSSTTG